MDTPSGANVPAPHKRHMGIVIEEPILQSMEAIPYFVSIFSIHPSQSLRVRDTGKRTGGELIP